MTDATPLIRVPVWSTLRDAVDMMGREWRRLILVATPVVLYAAASYFVLDVTDLAASTLWEIIVVIPEILLSCAFTVGWYRILLLGPQSGISGVYLRFGKREMNVLAYTILVSLVIGIPLVVVVSGFTFLLRPGPDVLLDFSLESIIFYGALAVVFVRLLVKFAFVFPAIATDRRFGLGRSWALTKGAGEVIAVTVILGIGIPWAFEIAMEAILEVSSGAPLLAALLRHIIGEALMYTGLAFTMAVTALAFRARGGMAEETA